jgi:hypothetical protein
VGCGAAIPLGGNDVDDKDVARFTPATSSCSHYLRPVPAISAPLTMLVTLKTNPGAPTGKAHGNYRSGIWTKEWLKLRREASVSAGKRDS